MPHRGPHVYYMVGCKGLYLEVGGERVNLTPSY